MKKATFAVSIVIHAGLAFALLTASQHRASGKTYVVQLQEQAKKKKEEQPKPKAPPKVAKVDAKPKEQKVSAAPKPMPVAAPVVAAKMPAMVMPTDIAMSNEDIGDAVAIPIVRAPQAVAPTKVATFEPGAPRRHQRQELGAGPNLAEERCTDEPSKPEPVFKTEIEYTAAARSEGIEGKLKLKIVVGADGSVLSVEVLASVSPELDAAAVAAVKQWRFRPAMACGKPVAGGTYVLARRFELGD
ncbi:MAG: TonB family protein [Polyangia bacterium]